MSSPCLEGFAERRRRDMQLHRGLVVSEKQSLRVCKFVPILAAPTETSDVISTAVGGSDTEQTLAAE